jgi:splicing factor 3B subunit 1
VAATTPSASSGAETPSGKKKSRWDETPSGAVTPVITATPIGKMAMGLVTPTAAQMAAMTPEQVHKFRLRQELDERNRPMTDEELDTLFPVEGYQILDPPPAYRRNVHNRLAATPTPMAGSQTGYVLPPEVRDITTYGVMAPDPELPDMRPEDEQYFAKLLVDVDESTLDSESIKERRIMKLLLKLKNGTPQMRKSALRNLTDKAREFGPSALFSQILPLLMSPTLEDQERHLLVKVGHCCH